ncbi:hypothetical protein GS504_15635 [Rhodococcus hoagii]|nr:hypothetical protein [Prescottella equi]NKR94326.1 hypothetical protein [Prescottella equi]NKS58890.1 hypothetical protein [Prescottella equi]NKS69079.1 hypothetical protein [Prescottella equi]
MAVQWNGPAVAAKQKQATAHGVTQATEALLAHARSRAPLREGDLRRNSKADTDGNSGRVSFSSVYAARQHEEVGWHHPIDGEAKYLENAKNDFAAEFVQIVGNSLGGAL